MRGPFFPKAPGALLLLLCCYACGGTSAPAAVAPQPQPPLSRLRLPRFAEPQAPVLFDGSDALSPGGALLHYRFSFGDGSAQVDAGTARLHHAYAAEGVYAVSLDVEDLQGRTASCAATLTIRSGAPACATDADCSAGDLCRETRCTTSHCSNPPLARIDPGTAAPFRLPAPAAPIPGWSSLPPGPPNRQVDSGERQNDEVESTR
jgi:PKD domain